MLADVDLVTGPGGADASTFAASLHVRLARAVPSEDEASGARGCGTRSPF